MNYATHNDQEVDIDGTHFMGYVRASYDELVSLFGQPTDSDGYKVDAEWHVLFRDGAVATIYNWKNGRNYLGEDGTPVQRITEWNVGGRDGPNVYIRISAIIASLQRYGVKA